ncbi:MAG: bifunctional sterol desaturase/short chain dehydrogenase [Pseudanabaenaceae cyanobacterium SKYGB_i_bin29]|nr:bifunctional sterol desaturase/short chain dehydrogenase [Pseudanabaenaceae cyanobacterium SKYG29]MDW8421375.1 bifunctional sterol desaturase/short chain dehydrogenase [Pseudanabaenaceae cyanobacterium SKYGB_i_bin29]
MEIATFIFALLSIVFAEICRDIYHLAGHYWKPLQRWHNLHHRVFTADLEVNDWQLYQQAELLNDVPEAIFMVTMSLIVGIGGYLYHLPSLLLGAVYSGGFLAAALARSQGFLLQTDFTHKPGAFTALPGEWLVNRTYHWRHHFDNGRAYFSGTIALMDKLLGTALSLKGKTVAITGASGTMGQALRAELEKQGARVIPLTASGTEGVRWQLGAEAEHRELLAGVDILILNHGVNVYGARSPEAITTSYEVNAYSVWRWLELFFATVESNRDRAIKEVWVNTSEAEVSPAFSPLYELSKRWIGDIITLRRLDAPCIVRKIILGPFKSKLNPYGVMSARWVAWAIVALAKRDFRDIIVTINPLTYIFFPLKEMSRSLYFRLFTRKE